MFHTLTAVAVILTVICTQDPDRWTTTPDDEAKTLCRLARAGGCVHATPLGVCTQDPDRWTTTPDDEAKTLCRLARAGGCVHATPWPGTVRTRDTRVLPTIKTVWIA